MILLCLVNHVFIVFGYLLAALLAIITIYAIYIASVRRKYRYIPGPPVKSFFFGNGQDLNFNRVDNHLVFIKWTKEYGPLYKLLLFHRVLLFACSPELARELLTKSKYAKSEDLYTRFKTVLGVPFMGNGLATNINHEDWKVKRQALNPAFHRSFLEKLIDVFNKASDNLMTELDKAASSGETISILSHLHEATLEVIAKVAFSTNFKENERCQHFSNDLYQSMKFLTESGYNFTILYNPFQKKLRDSSKESCASVRKVVKEILEKRLSDFKSGKEVPTDILTIMLQNLSQICSKEDIFDEMVTLFIAGQETTANTLSFCLMELGRHPEYLERVREEIDTVIGNKEFISHSDIEKLDWVNAVLKETLRLYPPSGGTSREMPESGELCGHYVLKKTPLIINFFAIHYNYHENGFDFKPEWWLSSNSPQTDFNYMPFSLGMRSCIGKQFAYTEAKILLCKILQKFDYQLDPNQSFSVEEAATQRALDGVRATLTNRM